MHEQRTEKREEDVVASPNFTTSKWKPKGVHQMLLAPVGR